MVGLTAVRNNQSSNSASTNDVDYHQLEKFWNNLSPQARQDLLKIDKQTLFEHARKSMYCSRCYGLLLEGFVQIVTNGKSIQEAAVVNISYNMPDASKSLQDGRTSASNVCKDEIKDPSLHPWGGLTTTRDGSLTLLDCYACTKTLKGLQIVFDSARLRERERRMLYPDACGGGDRGWISQSIPSYGRVHGMREICALHTARLSSDSLVDFWSALGEETTRSLFRMKEEDFIERLMHRFDSKRFCRDCRRNVLREFKELKRARKEPRCNSDYCVADTAFLYKVSNASVHADWHQTFADSVTSYHHFDWAVGTGEGKCDIQEFENVGLNGSAQITGLDLGGLNACFITLRAWKLDGRCTELSVKAHALKGEECMHRRLTVADGFVSITTGDSIQRFFEHAEEAEEEEDDDSLDKDGSDLDGECSLPQKHAKSPELAREFLLDASIVIFKEQVERAFREGTARQNAHSIFVCLALKLLEERLGLACKDIITFEKQMKLLEEEEKERREEEEQKERKKMKEREKKLRRKERLKGKYKDTEEKTSNLEETPSSNISKEELLLNADEVVNEAVGSKDAVSTNGETVCDRQVCSNIEVEGPFLEVEDQYVNHGISPEQMKASHGKLQPRKPVDQSLKWYDRHQFSFVAEDGPKVGRSIPRYHSDNSQNNSRVIYVANRQLNANHQKTNLRSSASRNSEKFHCGNGRMNERLEGHSCGCNHVCDYQTNNDLPVSAIRTSRGSKYMVKSESVLDVPKHLHGGSKYCQAVRSKSKVIIGSNYHGKKDSIQFRKVWEPLEAQKRCPRSNSASDIHSINSGFKIEQASSDSTKSSSELCSSSEDIGDSTEINHQSTKMRKHIKEKGEVSRSEAEDGTAEPTQAACAMKSSCSNSDNCSSCPSEGDSNTPSPNDENPGSSSTSDSECVSQQTELRVDLGHNGVSDNVSTKAPEVKNRVQTSVIDQPSLGFLAGGSGNSHYAYPSIEPPSHPSSDQNSTPSSMGYKSHAMFPDRRYHQNLCLQMFQTPSNVGYYAHQNLISWAPFPASGLYPHANSYLYPGFLGYGLDANQGLCMPYEAMHHFTTRMISGGPTIPFSNPAQGPAPPTNGIYVEKKPQLSKQSTGGKLADSTIYRERPSEASRPGGRRDLLAEACQENSGFSLFQFGVPFGVPFGMPVDASNTKLPEDGETSDASSMVPTDAVKDSFPDCCEEEDTTIEQYNLFAANCGTMFSFP